MKTAVGVVYFPNDGIDKEKTDALFYELLENITNFNYIYRQCTYIVYIFLSFLHAILYLYYASNHCILFFCPLWAH